MCVVAAGPGISAGAALTANIAIASTVASLGMAAIGMQQQAAAAQAQMNMQAQQAQRQQEMQRQQMIQQQNQQRDQQILSQRQNQQAYNLQVAQSNAAMLQQYQQQRRQVLNDRASIMERNEAQRLTYQRDVERARLQTDLNAEAANRVYKGEQAKIIQAKKKAAFEQQAILAKAIGTKGTILAAGRTGQSVGLLINDVERQAGFATAQETAQLKANRDIASIAMESAYIQNQSADNQAFSQISFKPSDPYMPSMPDAPAFIDGSSLAIGIPS